MELPARGVGSDMCSPGDGVRTGAAWGGRGPNFPARGVGSDMCSPGGGLRHVQPGGRGPGILLYKGPSFIKDK